MAEYICKEDAIKLIREDEVEITPLLTMITPYYSAEQAFDAINQACERHIAFVRDLPLEDVQPVVRCKDCKHFHLDYFGEVNGVNIIVAHEICDLWAGGCRTMQNAFCSNGVRRDGKDG